MLISIVFIKVLVQSVAARVHRFLLTRLLSDLPVAVVSCTTLRTLYLLCFDQVQPVQHML